MPLHDKEVSPPNTEVTLEKTDLTQTSELPKVSARLRDSGGRSSHDHYMSKLEKLDHIDNFDHGQDNMTKVEQKNTEILLKLDDEFASRSSSPDRSDIESIFSMRSSLSSQSSQSGPF